MLSVIVPCHNESAVIGRLLQSLVDQAIAPDEVIVVDSNCEDDTMVKVGEFRDKLSLQIVTATKKGVAEARNTGAVAATGETLLFVDADSILPTAFISEFLTIRAHRRLDAGGFTQRMPSKSFGIRFGARMMNVYARTMQHTPWPIAFSCIFSQQRTFHAIGGFDPAIYLMEDYDFVLRAHQQGRRVGIVSTPFIASDRRYVGEKKMPIWRGVYAELYRYTHGLRITKPIIDYKMGGARPDSKQ